MKTQPHRLPFCFEGRRENGAAPHRRHPIPADAFVWEVCSAIGITHVVDASGARLSQHTAEAAGVSAQRAIIH